MDQSGIADPTGGGLGFSFVRVSSKPHKEDVPQVRRSGRGYPSMGQFSLQVPKRLVTGTNADLRKLPLKEAKEMCRDYGVREEEINALSRWEIIDVIRTLSTQAAKNKKEGEGGGGLGGGGGGGGGGGSGKERREGRGIEEIFQLQWLDLLVEIFDSIWLICKKSIRNTVNISSISRIGKRKGGRGESSFLSLVSLLIEKNYRLMKEVVEKRVIMKN